MSAGEFKARLEATKREIARVEAEMESLGQAKDRAIAAGDGATAVKLKHQVDVLQKPLEDLVITKAAFEAKLRIYKTNETEGLKIIRRLADELYPEGIRHYEELKESHAKLQSGVGKIVSLNNEMEALANQIKSLIGDRIYTPRIPIPPELDLVATAKFGVDPPKSLDIRLGIERERDRLADVLKQQRPTIKKILRRVNIEWPVCQTCGAELLATRYELAEDESRGFASLQCSQHPAMYLEITFPPRPPPPGARFPIPTEGPVPLGDVHGSVPAIPSHGLASPGRDKKQEKGGETK